jgi:uncharacterized RmlC-like cupin family protein
MIVCMGDFILISQYVLSPNSEEVMGNLTDKHFSVLSGDLLYTDALCDEKKNLANILTLKMIVRNITNQIPVIFP